MSSSPTTRKLLLSKNEWDVDHIYWLRERVDGEHHQALTQYLSKRTQRHISEADTDGLTTSEIMRKAFFVENGDQTVPQRAIRLVRQNIPGVDLSFVIALCRSSREATGHIMELAKVLRKRENLTEEAQAVVDEATVREVIES